MVTLKANPMSKVGLHLQCKPWTPAPARSRTYTTSLAYYGNNGRRGFLRSLDINDTFSRALTSLVLNDSSIPSLLLRNRAIDLIQIPHLSLPSLNFIPLNSLSYPLPTRLRISSSSFLGGYAFPNNDPVPPLLSSWGFIQLPGPQLIQTDIVWLTSDHWLSHYLTLVWCYPILCQLISSPVYEIHGQRGPSDETSLIVGALNFKSIFFFCALMLVWILSWIPARIPPAISLSDWFSTAAAWSRYLWYSWSNSSSSP